LFIFVHLFIFHNRYNDVDYAGDKVERKSTSGGCHLVGGNLISWMSKKQDIIALSTIKFEHISTAPIVERI